VREAWRASYAPETNAAAMRALKQGSLPDRVIHLLSRLAFRGIYFPQMTRKDWVRVLFQNRGAILRVIGQAVKMKLYSRFRSRVSPGSSAVKQRVSQTGTNGC